VFGLGPATRIYVAVGATDMRKGFDGLYGLARDKLGLEVRSGHLFLFVNPLKMQDPELVTQLKERLPETLFEKFNGSLSIDQERLKLAEYKVRVLEEKLRLVRIDKYGPGSEKLSDAQLELLDLEPGVSSAEVQAESERAQLKLPLKRAQKHPGRQELPANLPRVEQMIACTAQQCVCGNCGKEATLRSVTRLLSNWMSNRLNTSCG
jgi:hypothetical protein